jgi:thioredoxin 1
MKITFLLFNLFACLISCTGNGPYDERADAAKVISSAKAEAKIKKLPVVIVFGANWCPDCRALSDAIVHGENANQIKSEFKIVKINVGNFDTNLDVANAYGNPISGGIPGATILSYDGKLIYVTKPGELANARSQGDEGIYTFFKRATNSQN